MCGRIPSIRKQTALCDTTRLSSSTAIFPLPPQPRSSQHGAPLEHFIGARAGIARESGSLILLSGLGGLHAEERGSLLAGFRFQKFRMIEIRDFSFTVPGSYLPQIQLTSESCLIS